MTLRIFLKGQVHEWDSVPETIERLHETLVDRFPITLPQKYSLHFFDLHGYKRELKDSEDFSFFYNLAGKLKPLKLEIEDQLAEKTAVSTNSLLDSLSNALFKEQPVPAPLYQPQTTIMNSQQGDMLVEEQKHTIPGADPMNIEEEKNRYEKIMKLEDDDFTIRLKLREEMRNMLQNEAPFLAEIIADYFDHKEEPYDEPNPYKDTYLSSNPGKRKSKVNTIHKNVRCSVCGVFPIVGVRYRSTLLDDFDMCEDCEDTIDHPYPLIKIKQEEHEMPREERVKPTKKPLTNSKISEVEDKKGNKLNMTSLFSNLSLNDVGNIAAKIVKENPKEATNEMMNLLEKFNHFKIKNSTKSFEEEKGNGNGKQHDDDDNEGKSFGKGNLMHEENSPSKGTNETDPTLVDKALKLEELFPDRNFDYLYAFVKKHVDMSVEELTNQFFLQESK